MNFDQLETFISIYELTSFSRAANELNVTQPAVTARISALELELGCKLFTITTNKRPILTKEGKLFLNHAKSLVKSMHDAKQAINLSKKPTINLGFTPDFPSEIITKYLKEMKLENTYISIRRGADSYELVELILKNELTFAFAYNPVFNPELYTEKIVDVNLAFVVNKEHHLATTLKITEELLDNEKMICYKRKQNLWISIDERLKNITLDKIEVHDVELAKYLVSEGLGFTFLPETSKIHNEPKLCVKPCDLFDDLPVGLYAIYKKDIIFDNFINTTIHSSIEKIKTLVQ